MLILILVLIWYRSMLVYLMFSVHQHSYCIGLSTAWVAWENLQK
uniref:Uncharacterized protein n=1 Tax=Anguilla anguilla TaxID=7936 RepID=A0A0E9UC84_ANGAN